MSYLISQASSEAAVTIGDDKFSRVTRDNWKQFINKRMRMMCIRMRLVKRRAYFSIEADNEVYSLPTNCVQMTRLQFNPTPSDRNVYRDLNEKFEDEFRSSTSNQYPTGDPTHYFADQGFFYLLPMPTTDVTLGGKIEYWGLPDGVTSQDQTFSLPDSMYDILVQGIVIDALRKMEKFDQAQVAEGDWEATIDRTRNTLEDRSADRRSKVRVGAMQRGFMGQT